MVTDYDIDDNNCDNCELEFHQLIEKLVKDIQHLEAKTVYLRYLLSQYFPKHTGEMLRSDIFSDLYGNNYDYPAYQRYISKWCSDRDPLDNRKRCKYMMRVSRGEVTLGL